MPEITIPFNFTPRSYQLPLLAAMDDGCKRAVCVWHRRAGKDKTLVNIISKKVFQRVGSYFYFFPTYAQGKKILWLGRDKDGFSFLDHFPKEIIKRKNDSDMLIEFINGSILQIIGTDNVDSIVGTNPVGCVFSEYALQHPSAWDFIRPILRENGGWAIFNFTPRGNNHGKTILDIAKKSGWFCQVLTVEDTGAISAADIEQERLEGMSEELIQQEYYCSFDAALVGAYYGSYMRQAEKENRVTTVPHEPLLPVYTAWDLGMNDEMVITFFQLYGAEIRIIDIYHNHGQDLAFYAKVLRSKLDYRYDTHVLPHDANVREQTSGITRATKLRELLGNQVIVLPPVSLKHGIELVRGLFKRFYIDLQDCETLINALKQYRQEYDEERKTYQDHPLHDWTSHFADSIRYMAMYVKQHHGEVFHQVLGQQVSPSFSSYNGDGIVSVDDHGYELMG